MEINENKKEETKSHTKELEGFSFVVVSKESKEIPPEIASMVPGKTQVWGVARPSLEPVAMYYLEETSFRMLSCDGCRGVMACVRGASSRALFLYNLAMRCSTAQIQVVHVSPTPQSLVVHRIGLAKLLSESKQLDIRGFVARGIVIRHRMRSTAYWTIPFIVGSEVETLRRYRGLYRGRLVVLVDDAWSMNSAMLELLSALPQGDLVIAAGWHPGADGSERDRAVNTLTGGNSKAWVEVTTVVNDGVSHIPEEIVFDTPLPRALEQHSPVNIHCLM